MNRPLGLIAGAGLGLALLFFALAAALSPDIVRQIGHAQLSGEPLSQPGVKQWAWDGGDRLDITMRATVHYQKEGSPRVIVRGPANLLDRVLYDHGKLTLAMRARSRDKLDVTLTGMTLRQVMMAGDVDLTMGEIHQDRLDISIAGRGSAEASGNVDSLSLKIAGSGDYHLGKLVAKSLTTSSAGSGGIEIGAAEHAQVSIIGSGEVNFAGAMPTDISTNIIGSGTIRDAKGRVIDGHGLNHQTGER